MGRLNTFELLISNQYGKVEAGSILQGQVVLDCSDDMEVKEIIVHCFGKCRVQWVDTRAAAPLAEVQAGITPPVSAEENYINEYITCFPNREEGQADTGVSTAGTTKLTKGMHTFDFAFQIPAAAPASFTADHGFIKYVIRAQVHLPNKVESNVRYFTVCPVFDLNHVPNVEEEVEKNGEVEVMSLIRHWGKCKAQLALPKRGFVLGDAIPVTLMINNESNKDIGKARLRLRMVTRYKIKSQTCTGEKILAESKLASISAGHTFDECDKCLRIPKEIPASHLHGCKFMHVKYYVELFIRPTLLSIKKLRMSVKIHIGTIPITLAREEAYLRMREAPPSYEDLLPSYQDAIRLHLSEVDPNTASNHNSQITHQPCEASSSSERFTAHPRAECGVPGSHAGSSSNMNSICSSLDSLISMSDVGTENNVKPVDTSENFKFIGNTCTAERLNNIPETSFVQDLRISVLRHNFTRTAEEVEDEVPMITDEDESDSPRTSRRTSSKRSFLKILHSISSSFPLLLCHKM